METETLVSSETHETVVTNPDGTESSVVETTTHETELPAPVEIEAVEIEDEGIDEKWLEERFSRLGDSLLTLINQVSTFQVNQTELVNKLITMNQQLQLTITEMAEKVSSKNMTPPVMPIAEEVIAVVNPAESESVAVPEEVKTEQPAAQTRKARRKI